MFGEKVKILGASVDKITMSEAVDRALSYIEDGGFHAVYTPNPEIIWAAQTDQRLMNILNEADMVLPDGIGVVIASKILKNPMPERVPGFDFVCNLLSHGGLKFFLFGSAPGVADKAAFEITKKYPDTQIAGTVNGYFSEDEVPAIIDKINNSGADVLLVCLGAPKQEKWIFEHKDALKTALCVGAGGSLDVLAGAVKRAPEAWQKLNLEWAYRLLSDPRRIGRQMALPKFLLKVIFSKKK